MFKKVINAYNVSTGNRREKAKKQACSGLLVASTATGSVRDPVSRHKTEINRAGHLTPSSSFNMCTFLHSANLVHLKAGNETQQPLHSLGRKKKENLLNLTSTRFPSKSRLQLVTCQWPPTVTIIYTRFSSKCTEQLLGTRRSSKAHGNFHQRFPCSKTTQQKMKNRENNKFNFCGETWSQCMALAGLELDLLTRLALNSQKCAYFYLKVQELKQYNTTTTPSSINSDLFLLFCLRQDRSM